NEKGRPWFNERRRQERGHVIEQVGSRLRAMMPFLDPVSVTEEGEVVKARTEEQGRPQAPAPAPRTGTAEIRP
ncbi:MAG TPA: hypothetical protein VGL15_13920, partial [Vicinamibacteria bacterium]